MTALDDYGPFDAGLGANRNEDFWRDYFRHLTGSGVIDGIGSEFAVSERGAGANMSVDVASGECFIRGHWGESTSTKNMAISAAHATLARIDRVVLRTDFTANTISIEVIEGTPNATPAAPALTQSSSRWEISLAQISIPAADTSIGSAQITSERTIIGFPTFDQSTAPADGDTWTYNATTGLWEPAASSGTSEGFRAYRSTTQGLSASTTTTIVFDTEVQDQGGDYNPATGEWTVPVAGWYIVGGSVGFASLADGASYTAVLYVNGVATATLSAFVRAGGLGGAILAGSLPLYLTAGQVVTLRAFRSTAGDVEGSAFETFFTAVSM